MHSRFAAAAGNLPALKLGLSGYLGSGARKVLPNFGSATLLSWAQHMPSIAISDGILGCPGLAELMAVAVRATTVRVECRSLVSSARADQLLQKCSAVTKLTLAGSVMPTHIPSTVTTLHAELGHDGLRPLKTDPWQCNALLKRAGSLPCLRHLSLDLCTSGRTYISCPVRLPHLQELNVELIVGTKEVDLSWVQLQACPALDCTVDLTVVFTAKQKAVADQLKPLAIRKLSLYSDIPFSGALQKIWSQLRVCSLHLGVGDDMFLEASGALQYLPESCTKLVIKAAEHGYDREIFINWAALVSHAMHIRLIAESYVGVQILDAGPAAMAAPSCLQQPWQLVVQGAKSVQGLPASLATGNTYFQQNAAACDAGWTDDTE